MSFKITVTLTEAQGLESGKLPAKQSGRDEHRSKQIEIWGCWGGCLFRGNNLKSVNSKAAVTKGLPQYMVVSPECLTNKRQDC